MRLFVLDLLTLYDMNAELCPDRGRDISGSEIKSDPPEFRHNILLRYESKIAAVQGTGTV